MNKNKLENIYSKESGKMLSYIKKHLSQNLDVYDEMDVLQDTFDALFEKIDVLKPIDNLTAYIYRSLRNKMIDLFRKRRLDYDCDIMIENISVKDSTSEHMEHEELMEMVWLAIEELPDKQRAVFMQTEIEGKSFKEISSETGISINTLLSQKRYAIKKLQKTLGE